MSCPLMIPVEKKVRIVLSVLQGEVLVAEVACREKVSGQVIGSWKRQFLDAGKTSLVAGKAGPSSREQQLEAEGAELIRCWVRLWSRSGCGRRVRRAAWVLRGPRGDPR